MVPVVVPGLTAVLTDASVPLAAFELPAKKPRVWTVFAVWLVGTLAGMLAAVAACVAVGFVIGVVKGFQGATAEEIQASIQVVFQQPLLALVLALVPFQLGIGLVALLAARWSKEPLRQRIGLVPPSGTPVGSINLASMAGLTLSAAVFSVMGSSLLLGEPATNVIGAALNDGSLLTLTLASIILSLVPAVVEEIVFRGYIQRRLLQRWSPKVAIGVTTLLFALLHADSLQHILAVVPLGIVTGLLAYRTGSIKSSILLHSIHNAGVAGMAAGVRLLGPILGDEGVGMVLIGGMVVLSLAGTIAIVRFFRQPKPQEVSLEMSPPIRAEMVTGQAA